MGFFWSEITKINWESGLKCRNIYHNVNQNCRKARIKHLKSLEYGVKMPKNIPKWEHKLPKIKHVDKPTKMGTKMPKIYQNGNQNCWKHTSVVLNCRKSITVCLNFIKKLNVGLSYNNSNAEKPITCIYKLPILPKLPRNQSKVKPKVPTNQSSVLQIIKQT